jgi:predicted Zn-dependent peptidase
MKFSKKILKNGLRVITVPMRDNPTVTVLVLVETGSKYETKKINGLSHFLEHMCFKGTIKRPKAINISKELDALGSQYNAFTAQEYTGYYAKAEAKHFRKVFDILSDIYLNSTFSEAEIQKEKGVIIEEINMYDDLPPRHVQDLFMKLLYGDQPAGWNIAGEKENVRRMQRRDFLRYKQQHYLPEATVLVVAGKITEKEVLREVEKNFGQAKRGKKGKKKKVIEKQKKPEMRLEFKETDQSHFVFGVRACNLFDKRNVSLAVLAGILGGGMSSRLFQKLREEMGVGYYLQATADVYTDHGFLEISAGVDNRRIEEVIQTILGECRKLKKESVLPEELEKTKEYLIGNLKLSLETSDDLANFCGGQELLKGEIKNIGEKAREIRRVSAKEIKSLAGEIFQNQRLNLALLGPFKQKQKFTKILKF